MTREELKRQWTDECFGSNPLYGYFMNYTDWLERKIIEKEMTIKKDID
jgi:hypothetical protein